MVSPLLTRSIAVVALRPTRSREAGKQGGGGYELPPLTRCASYANTMLPRHSVMPFYTHSTHSKSTTTCKGCH